MRLFLIDASRFLRLGLIFMEREKVTEEGRGASLDSAGGEEISLGRAEERWRRGDPAAVGEAVRLCDEVLARLPAEAWAERARVWLRRGQFCESGRTPEALAEAVRSHETGLKELEPVTEEEAGSGAAVGAGERRLRALLWMNRGNALLALGRAEPAREALRSYDTALALLARGSSGDADAAGEVETRAMVGAAWLNRAAAARLAAERDAALAAEEARSLDLAIRELGEAARAGSRPARRNLAGAWLNRAARRERVGDGAGARAAWNRAVETAAPESARDAVALETGLRARHALCVEAGRRLAAGETPSAAEEAEVILHVESGLEDFSRCDANARTRGAREAADRLFEFGAWFLRLRFPRRLADFLARHGEGAEPARLVAARVAMGMARQEILRTGFADLLSAEGEEARERLRELGALEARLGAWEERCRQGADTPRG